jgi:hypothetical protein
MSWTFYLILDTLSSRQNRRGNEVFVEQFVVFVIPNLLVSTYRPYQLQQSLFPLLPFLFLAHGDPIDRRRYQSL